MQIVDDVDIERNESEKGKSKISATSSDQSQIFRINSSNSLQQLFENISLARKWTDEIGLGKYQYKRLILPFLGWFVDAVEGSMAGLLLFAVKESKDFGEISTDETSLLVSCTYMGQILGCIFFGMIADRFGRKYIYNLLSWGLFSVAFGATFSNSFTTLIILRTFTGFFIGGQVPLSVTITGEITPTTNISVAIGIICVGYALGSEFSSLMGYLSIQVGNLGWRYFVALCSVPSLLQCFFSVFFYTETARYAEASGNVDLMRDILISMAEENAKSSHHLIGEIKQSCKQYNLLISCKENEKTELFKGINTKRGNLIKLFTYPTIRVTLTLMVGFFCNYFAINSLNMFVQQVYKIRGFDAESIYTAALISNSAYIPGVLSMYFLHRWLGHRWSLVVASLGTAVFSIAFGYVETLSGIQVVSWFFSYFSSLAMVIFYFVTPMSFNSGTRATAMGFCSMGGKIGGFLTPYIINSMLTSYPDSVAYPYLVIAVANCLVCALFLLCLRKSDIYTFQKI